jgi:short-subunit dehydrogenase
VNILSITSVAPFPVLPSYSISKAAALSLTQSLRALLTRQGVVVHAVILGSIDTDMSRGYDFPKCRQSSLRQVFSMAWRKGRRTSFLIQHRRRLQTAGAQELPKRLSAGSTRWCWKARR